jgi:ABC-type branched-subunit amino acid transport system substrate-binding protein
MRTTMFRGGLVAAVLLGLMSAVPLGLEAQPPPIKLGFTTDLTGTAAQAAKDMVNGLTL